MPILECPSCRWLLVLPERKVGISFACLNCEQPFDTQAAAVVIPGPGRGNPPPVVPEPPPADASPGARAGVAPTLLSRSHLCCQCEQELTAIGRRRATLECPHCHRTTSVYAVLHRCPECEARIESPRRCVGSTTRCPRCQEPLTVPSDILYNDDRALPDHTWLGFRCSGCGAPLQAPASHSRQEAVCPQCERPLTIPAVGERVAALPAVVDRDLARALHNQVTHPCPHCGQPSPRQARVCRHCGKQT